MRKRKERQALYSQQFHTRWIGKVRLVDTFTPAASLSRPKHINTYIGTYGLSQTSMHSEMYKLDRCSRR